MDHSLNSDSTFCSLVDKNKKHTPKKISNRSTIKNISKEIHSHLDGKYLLDNSRVSKYLQVVSKIKPRSTNGKKKIDYLIHILNLIYKKNNMFTDSLLSQELSTSQQHMIENFDFSQELRIVENYNDLKSTDLASEDLFSEDSTQNISKTIFSSNQTNTDITPESINALKPSNSNYLDADLFSSKQTTTDITAESINALKPSHLKYPDVDLFLSNQTKIDITTESINALKQSHSKYTDVDLFPSNQTKIDITAESRNAFKPSHSKYQDVDLFSSNQTKTDTTAESINILKPPQLKYLDVDVFSSTQSKTDISVESVNVLKPSHSKYPDADLFPSNPTKIDVTAESINKPSNSKYLDVDPSISFNSSMLSNQNFVSSNLSNSNKIEGLSLSLKDIHISDKALESRFPKYNSIRRNLSSNKTISLVNTSNKTISKSLELNNVGKARKSDEILEEISKVITTFLNNKDNIENKEKIIEYLMKNVNSTAPDVSKSRATIKQLYNTQLSIVARKTGDKSSGWEELSDNITQLNCFNQQISSLFDDLQSIKCEKDEQYCENLGKKVEKELSTHLDSEALQELNLVKHIQGSILICKQISMDFQERFPISNVQQNTLDNEELADLNSLDWKTI